MGGIACILIDFFFFFCFFGETGLAWGFSFGGMVLSCYLPLPLPHVCWGQDERWAPSQNDLFFRCYSSPCTNND